jgi:hypothetical protein
VFGTVVKVKCSGPVTLKEGKNKVICSRGKLFFFKEEPDCENPGTS